MRHACCLSLLSLTFITTACPGRELDNFSDGGPGGADQAGVDRALPATDRSVVNPTICSLRCEEPPPAGSVCISGQVVDGPLFFRSGTRYWPTGGSITTVKIYNPTDMFVNPDVEPLASVSLEAEGCFMAPSVQLPFHRILAFVVDDASSTVNDYARTATIYSFEGGDPDVDDLPVPAVRNDALDAASLAEKGTALLWYHDPNYKGVAGVTPPIPDGTQVLFFDGDLSALPYYVTGITATRSSGLVAVEGAPTATYSGTKPLCYVDYTIGGSSPGMLTVLPILVTCP